MGVTSNNRSSTSDPDFVEIVLVDEKPSLSLRHSTIDW